jgi:lipoate-protein ligase B
VAYPIFDLQRIGLNVRQYIHALEEVVIRVLAEFSIDAGRHPRFMGVWVGDEKICAVGVGVRKWITKHGLAFNINTDLNYFQGIIPCGIRGKDVTSLQKIMSEKQDMDHIKDLTRCAFADVFNLDLQPVNRSFIEEGIVAHR